MEVKIKAHSKICVIMNIDSCLSFAVIWTAQEIHFSKFILYFKCILLLEGISKKKTRNMQ